MAEENEFPEIAIARAAFASRKTRSIEFRRQQLQNFMRMIDDPACRDLMHEAMYKDLRRSAYDVTMTDILGVKMEIGTMLRNLDKWLKDDEQPTNLLAFADKSKIRLEPRGVVLILGTWNYPFFLALKPLVGAIAAGNCAIVKPSEVSKYSADVVAQLIPKYLDTDCYHVVLGDVERTKALLRNQFDYIFFTGSTNVGKAVLQAAAPHLTPTTLELGGKSPVYIDESAATVPVFKRILWGKLMNFGQTCIAPDYVVCTKDVQELFMKHAPEILTEWYDDHTKLQSWEGFARIINKHHLRRIQKLLEKTQGTVRIGGRVDEDDLWIEPTFVENVQPGDSLLSDEIFGPILPFVVVKSVDEAITIMNSMGTPLAAYVFSKDEKVIQKVLDSVPSGGVCVNDVIFHVSDTRIPFGGLGTSGFGGYNGKYSLEAFSHKRSILTRSLNTLGELTGAFRYPPYSDKKRKQIENGLMIKESLDLAFGPILTHLAVFALGCLLTAVIFTIQKSFP